MADPFHVKLDTYVKKKGEYELGTPGYEKVFDTTGILHGWSTNGELEHGNGELYAVGIVELSDGTFREVPINLITRTK